MTERDIPQPDRLSLEATDDETVEEFAEDESTMDTSSGDTDSQTHEELENLLSLAREVFNRVSSKVEGIADEHIQDKVEVITRKNGRALPLRTLRTVVATLMRQEYVAEGTKDDLFELYETARDGRLEVSQQTEGLYDPNSMYTFSANFRQQDKGLLESKAAKYVVQEGATHEDIPLSFINGIRAIDAASDAFVKMGDKLSTLFSADNSVDDAFSTLNSKLHNFPRHYDEDAMRSMLRALDEAIASVEDSDRKRNSVSEVAKELHHAAEELKAATEN